MKGFLPFFVAVTCLACAALAGENAACSRDEVADFFAKNIYGELPPKPAELRFELVEKGEAFEGAAERRQYVVKAADAKGSRSFEVLVYLPKGAKGPVPAFVYPNFYGNHTLTSDLAVRRYAGFALDGTTAGYGEKSARAPVEEVVAHGYAFATYCYSALYSDRTGTDAAAESVWNIFDPSALPEEKLAHPAWAWGGMRVRDLLATLPEIAQDKVAVAGQSRMGKNALVIGVNDPRFALVCANCGGTKWLRHLPNLKFPAWFSKKMGAWAQNGATGLSAAELEKRAAKLPPPPFEQDAYLGLVAPRALMVSASDVDRYAPPEESRAVYEAAKTRFDACGGKIAWHLKKGPHSITAEDWAAFLGFADEVFGVTPPPCAPPELDVSDDRVESLLRVDLKRLGTLKPRAANEIASSNWRLGCETLDRDFADFEAYKRYLGPLGIKTVRLQGGWAKCEKAKGVYDFAWLDRIVDHLVANGIEPAIETDYGNPIYAGGGGSDLAGGFPTGDAALAAWDRWVDALTRHFAGRVKVWMMWNEPDYSIGRKKTPEEIAAFNVRTAKIVKRNIPDAKIAGLSLAGSDPAFLEKCLKPMGEDVALFDWIVYHGYEAAPETSYANVEAMKAVVAKAAPRAKLWQGENGAPSEWATKFALSGIPWTEYAQAKWDLRRMLGDLGHDVFSSIFTICDFNHIGREINRKGLLRADAWHRVTRVKRAYYAVQNLASVFDDRWTRDRDFVCADPTLSAYRYLAKDGTPLVVFWTHRSSAGQKGFERPGDSFETKNIPRNVLGIEDGDRVWVDLLTGRIYELPKDRATVPAYDSPCLVTARGKVLDK